MSAALARLAGGWVVLLLVCGSGAAAAGSVPQFLVVAYHPVSKTLAADVPGPSPLYDYVYRIDVRNAGAAADEVVGTVRSSVAAVLVTDARAAFSSIGANRTAASTDTVTIRAGRFFDRRLDRTTPAGTGWRYVDAGTEGPEDRVPGFPAGLSVWNTQLTALYYDLKFQFLLQWSFTAGGDRAGPVISQLAPQQEQNDARPAIGASFKDQGTSGIDTGTILMQVDGEDVSARARNTATGVSYRPARDLEDGWHDVALRVADRAGNVSKAAWSFVVDTRAPVIGERTPDGIKNASPTAAVGVDFSDAGGSGIDTARTTLVVDSIDVSAIATRTDEGMRYFPVRPFADGTHRVVLTLFDLAGNRQAADWSFGVDSRGVKITRQLPADGAVLAADIRPAISAVFDSVDTTVVANKTVLTLDGRNVTSAASVTAAGITYTAPVLAEGTHRVVLSVTDKRGYVSELNWNFITRTAPVIDTAAPAGVVPAGQSPLRISATYHDIGAGIDPAATRLLMDGVDFTAQAQHDKAGLVFVPAITVPQGLHVMLLTVADKAGNASSTAWRFTIDSGAPAISAQAPKDMLVTTATPRVTALFQDSGTLGSGIDTARIKLFIDNIDVTARAQISATGIAYTPATILASGAHTVRLSVPDMAGNTSESTWSFMVDAQGPLVAASLTPAPGSMLPADAIPVISATYADDGAGIDTASVVLKLDGVAVTGLAQVSATGIRFAPALALAEGAHHVVLTLADKGGNAVEKSWSFTTRTPPSIDGMSPGEGLGLPAGSPVSIALRFHDVGSGVDLASVHFLLDGVDRTASATIDTDGVLRYVTAPGALPPGKHVINLALADNAGNPSSSAVHFTIEPLVTTVISDMQPSRNSSIVQGTPFVIGARFADVSGIDPARTRIMVDETDLTAAAQASGAGFTLQPPALAVGSHLAYVRVANTAGRETTAIWRFEIEAPGAYAVRFIAPEPGQGVSVAAAVVKVVAGSDIAGVIDVTLNGKSMERLLATGNEATFGATVDLAVGNNTLTASARFSDGHTRATSQDVDYGVAPVIAITSPADRSTLGAVLATSPRDLTGNVERPVTLTGTSSKPVARVTVNQQQAVVSGTSWRFDNFFLHEGVNLLTAVATDAQGRIGTASVTVSVDQTAPFLSVEAPRADAVTSANTIDVRGTVNDAVEGYYSTGEPQVMVGSGAGSVTAAVGDKQYLAANVPLALGSNTLDVTATDGAGNKRTTQLRVTRVGAGSPRLTVEGGNGQAALAGTPLAQPLTVTALDQFGRPLSAVPVTFDITRGTGGLAPAQDSTGKAPAVRNLVVLTDANGRASVWLVLGKQSGPGSNGVRASSPAIAEEANFVATGQKGPAQHIRADLGINQYVATGTQPLEPLTAVVTDSQENRIAGAEVLFSVAAGSALFENGRDSIIVKTDRNGYAAVRPTLGTQGGATFIKAVPAENGDAFFEATFTLQGLVAGEGPTRFSGQVTNDKGQPLPGARMSIGRTALSTTVDEKGLFSFDDVPPGKIDLFVDGRTVNVQGQQYPALHFEAAAVKGAQNQLPHPIYLPQLEMAEAKIVGGDQDVVLKMPGFEGYEMTVFANSVTFPDGSRSGPLVVSPISFDKLPMTPPGGYAGFMAPAATIQPSGTRFDPPVQLKIPNTAGLKPGEKKPVYQWDHDLATFVQMGQATVTEDGAFLITDAGTGISKAGWHPIPNPPPPDDCPSSGGAPTCATCTVLTTSAGRCPVKSCKPDDGARCDDGKYCTTSDTCKNGACKGTKVDDIDGATNGYEVNLSAVNGIFKLLKKINFPDLDVKMSVSMQSSQMCCESRQGEMLKGIKGKLDAKVVLGIPPWPVVGAAFAFPSLVPGLDASMRAGLFLSAEVSGGLNGTVNYSQCAGTPACWGGGGAVAVDITGELGVVVKDGPITAVKVTGTMKSGVQVGVKLDCDGGVLGGEWSGVQGAVVFEFNDGQIHFERNWQFIAPTSLGKVEFATPAIDK